MDVKDRIRKHTTDDRGSGNCSGISVPFESDTQPRYTWEVPTGSSHPLDNHLRRHSVTLALVRYFILDSIIVALYYW